MKRLFLVLVLLAATLAFAGRRFNGTSDNATLLNSSGTAVDVTSGQMTASCWFYLTSAPGSEADCLAKWALGFTGGYVMIYNASGHSNQVGAAIYITIPLNHVHTVFCSNSVSTNTWHQLAFRYQNNNLFDLWFDGAQCATDVGVGSTGNMSSSGTNLTIGSQQGTCCFFPGIIGEVAVWNNYFLSAGQMKALFSVCPVGAAAKRAGFPPPAGYWPLWGVSGASIEPDFSGNRLSVTLTGTTVGNHPPCQP